MCLTALALGASALGAVASSKAASKATKAQTASAKDQLALQERVYNEISANFAPYRTAGLNGFNALAYESGVGAKPADYQGFQETPGYEFMVNEGQRAIEGSAAASGNVLSGATMKALQDRQMGVANQEYNNYLNRLGNIGQMGQAAAGNQAAAGANFASGASQAYGNIGNAQAAGAIAQGNAITGGINNALSGYMMGQMLTSAAAG